METEMSLHVDTARVPPELPIDDARYTAGALQLFFRAMEAWGASVAQMQAILGLRSERTLHHWRKVPPRAIDPDHLRRIGDVLGIWKALNIVFGSPERARHWVVNPNQLLDGRSPLQVMARGDIADLDFIRAFAERERSPW
jgi:uncharacterized protein (DUF2384 family)